MFAEGGAVEAAPLAPPEVEIELGAELVSEEMIEELKMLVLGCSKGLALTSADASSILSLLMMVR